LEKEKIKKLLEDVQARHVSIDDALNFLKLLPYEDLGFAKIDSHRELRTGFPEVIYCQGKSLEQISKIVKTMLSSSKFLMATKAEPDIFEAIRKIAPDSVYHETARIVVIGQRDRIKNAGLILVITAGSSDIPVAEEAAVTAEAMGNPVERLFDVGVAGIHRLFEHKDILFKADVLIAVAGMEGALASVIGGLVDKPVVAVPTSIGYGASFNGLSALLNMLNSCAPGIAVMNIDNGFGAGYFAGLINRQDDES